MNNALYHLGYIEAVIDSVIAKTQRKSLPKLDEAIEFLVNKLTSEGGGAPARTLAGIPATPAEAGPIVCDEQPVIAVKFPALKVRKKMVWTDEMRTAAAERMRANMAKKHNKPITPPPAIPTRSHGIAARLAEDDALGEDCASPGANGGDAKQSGQP